MNPMDGEALPPLPMTSTKARALGLTTFSSLSRCSVDGTNERTTHGRRCVACMSREKMDRQVRDQAIREKERERIMRTAKAAAMRELQAEERKRLREAEKARKAATRQAEKEAREKERKRALRALNAATKQTAIASSQFPVEASAAAVGARCDAEVPPWEL